VKTARRVYSFVQPYWRIVLGAYLSLLTITALNLVSPLILRWAIDSGISRSNMSVLQTAAALLVVLTLIKSIFQFLQGYLSEVASQGVAFDLRRRIYEHLEHLSFSYHDQAQTGQLMARATSDVEVLRNFTGRGFIALMNIVVLVIGVAIVLLAMNWKLALLSLTVFPLLLRTAVNFTRTFRPLSQAMQQQLAVLSTVLQENLAGARVVRAFAREKEQIDAFRDVNQVLLDKNIEMSRVQRRAIPLMDFVANLATVMVIWYGGSLVITHALTLGELVAFNTYLLQLVMPIRRMGFLVSMLSRAGASADRVFEILDAKSEVENAPDAVPLPAVEGHVRFEHVTFRYAGLETVLSDVSFDGNPGQVVALLGATGSGKSTIINLIPRFYDVSSGRITIDGIDIRKVTLESLRRQIGIVLQETVLFSGTVRENIAFGRPNASMDDVIDAARAGRAHDFITSFPLGYDTVVGERGVTLSGGQRQRVAIARALLMDPRILVLDDATSAVDSETERLIQEALAVLMRGRTSFVIAQRISTIRKADLILVLERGQIAAQGTHEELLEESGLYAELYGLQLRSEQAVSPGKDGAVVPAGAGMGRRAAR
jgi:ATP-binding cassette, subfamily B, multidrug efflux pump